MSNRKLIQLFRREKANYSEVVFEAAKQRLQLLYWLHEGEYPISKYSFRKMIREPLETDEEIAGMFWRKLIEWSTNDGLPIQYNEQICRRLSVRYFNQPVPLNEFPFNSISQRGRWLMRTHYEWLLKYKFVATLPKAELKRFHKQLSAAA